MSKKQTRRKIDDVSNREQKKCDWIEYFKDDSDIDQLIAAAKGIVDWADNVGETKASIWHFINELRKVLDQKEGSNE